MEKKADIKWDESLSVGIVWIDNQHKKLLNRINKLINAIIQKKSITEVGSIIRFLENYAEGHFNTESKYMLESSYQENDKHLKQHIEFIEKINNIRDEFRHAGASKELAVEIARETWNWYKYHISTADKALGEFLKKRKISDKYGSIIEWTDDLHESLDAFIMFESDDRRLSSINDMRKTIDKIESHLTSNK